MSLRGDEIRSLDTEIATLVTGSVEIVPDSHTLTVTVLLPTINLNLVSGPLETYEYLPLRGKARLLSF